MISWQLPFDSRFPLRRGTKGGFLAPLACDLGSFALKNQFVLSTQKALSPLFATDD
jgi:hypothetical protein